MDLFEDLPEPSAPAKEDKLGLNDSSAHHPVVGLSSGLFDDLPSVAAVNPDNAGSVIGMKRKSASDDDDLCQNNKMKCVDGAGCYKLCGYFACRKGERDEMQDTHVIIDDLMKYAKISAAELYRLAYYAVFDGHSGSRASKFCEKNMHKYIVDQIQKGDLSQLEKDVKKILTESYRKTDEDFLKEATKQKPAWKDGSTATTMLVVNNNVYLANIGDSKAILCRENEAKQVALTLTKDHNAEVYEERMRIQKAGGVVRDGRVMGVLEVSRSIGDGQFKKQGVTCLPDIKRCQLTEKDKYLVIACDGLWKTMTPDEVMKIVQEVKDTSQQTECRSSEDGFWDAVCNRLANESVRRLSGDNVTVIIISIKPK
ncbi:integrin-linked kinase-associated serine/threonine phosphatase 2C-like [Lineus longissimus]|uniref:integrin-linked kinase-associated serine/threonine phosphatase 2C-like n=1 Tax=Lineus longissimus TaxID=88925 RepID=UPI00315D450A